jgi:hypothetical protein
MLMRLKIKCEKAQPELTTLFIAFSRNDEQNEKAQVHICGLRVKRVSGMTFYFKKPFEL